MPSDQPTGATLFLALSIPGVDPSMDPEIIADSIALVLNEDRVRNGGVDAALDDDAGFDRPEVEPVMVAAIPAPQWLTPETLANLRRAASAGELPDPAVVRPEPPPDGHRWEWFIDEAWRLADIDASCRFMEAGKGCGAPAVARMKRGQRWFSYCGDHLYGRHIHDGKVWALRLVPLPEAVAARSSQPRTDLREQIAEAIEERIKVWFALHPERLQVAALDAAGSVLDLVARTHPDPGEALWSGPISSLWRAFPDGLGYAPNTEVEVRVIRVAGDEG